MLKLLVILVTITVHLLISRFWSM